MPMMPTSYFITFYYFDIGAAKTLIPAVNVCLKKCLKMFENLEHQAKCPAAKSTFQRQFRVARFSRPAKLELTTVAIMKYNV